MDGRLSKANVRRAGRSCIRFWAAKRLPQQPPRVMMLLFRGEDAVRKTRSVIGNISAERRGGETIRDTYGDLIIDENNQVRYFEPAGLAAPTPEEAASKLRLWAEYSDADGGVVEN